MLSHFQSQITGSDAPAHRGSRAKGAPLLSRLLQACLCFPISGLMFLLLAAGAARAEDPSGDTGLTTYAVAMHGQPALPADFSRLPYADPQATKGGHLTLAASATGIRGR